MNDYLRSWLAPSIVITLATAIFSMGFWLGQGDYAVDIRVLQERLGAHESRSVHPGAASLSFIQAKMEAIEARLHRIERKIDETK